LEAARDRVDERLAELRETRRAIDAALKHCAAGRCELTA
jgi:hypothetical protein